MPWEKLGSGCDKTFYVEAAGVGGYGAISCSDQVAARETKAYIDLKTIGVSLLPTILPWTDQKGFIVNGKTVRPQYMIERLSIDGTFKPQMCSLGVPKPVMKLLAAGDPDLLMQGFEELESKLDRICNIVGELTLAVDSTSGRLFMLDFSPAENGDRAINQIDTIRRGIGNLKGAL